MARLADTLGSICLALQRRLFRAVVAGLARLEQQAQGGLLAVQGQLRSTRMRGRFTDSAASLGRQAAHPAQGLQTTAATWVGTAAQAVPVSQPQTLSLLAARQISGPHGTELSALLRVALDRRLLRVLRAETGSRCFPAIFDLGQAAAAAVRRRSARADTAVMVLRAAVAAAAVPALVPVVSAVAAATAGF